MGTAREKSEMELDQGSVEQVRKLFNDYVVDPLGKEMKAAESDIRSNEETQMGALKNDLETELNGTNGRLEEVLQALGNPKNKLDTLPNKLNALGDRLENYLDDLNLEDKLTSQNETLENSLTSHLETLQNALCGSFAENTAQLTEQSDADKKAVLERVAALEQQLLTALGDSSTQMTEYRDDAKAELVEYQKTQQQFAVQKYKLLLGTSLAFGIVNFLGIVLLLYLNFMP